MGELSRVCLILDNSQSMNVSQGGIDVDTENQPSRMELLREWLLGKSESSAHGWLARMQDRFQCELHQPDDNDRTTSQRLWHSGQPPLPPEQFQADRMESPLGWTLQAVAETDPAAIVLLSDGQTNIGPPLSSIAKTAKEKNIPIHVIAMGHSNEPNDLAILSVEHSDRVLAQDLIRGVVKIKESMPPATAYQLVIEYQQRILWTKDLLAETQGVRDIEFVIPVETLLTDQGIQGTRTGENTCVAIDLDIILKSSAREVSTQNNRILTSLWHVVRRNRVLMLDHNGGWESRYIKNALQRDKAWDTTVRVGRNALGGEFFPGKRSALVDYDLIILAEQSAYKLKMDELSWLSEYISDTGGGLIVIGQTTDDLTVTPLNILGKLMPVRKSQRFENVSPIGFELTLAGKNQPAFQLSRSALENESLWSKLPPPKRTRGIELVPGAESFVEIITSETQESRDTSETKPWLAGRMFGQGRVIYIASDETWRWRFEVADLHHQRFWNQLMSWTMRIPFSIQGQYAALDTGTRTKTIDDSTEIRAKLRDTSMQPLEGALLQANIERDGVRVASISLLPTPGMPGIYGATLGAQTPGQYQVTLESPNVPQDALDVRAEFLVREPVNIEMNQLACNRKELQGVADATGGRLLALDQADQLTTLLSPQETSKVEETRWPLWHSPLWFATIISLFATELWLRKKAGLR
jgi:hypothetical protein